MDLSHKELYLILSSVGLFARSCNYLLEAYYITGMTLVELAREFNEGFKLDQYTKRYKEVFESEKKLKRIIKYPESYSVPLSKSSLEYYIHSQMIIKENGLYVVSDLQKTSDLIQKLEADLSGHLSVNLLN
jgi:glycerol-3-phosphate O-acyltransferase